MSITRPPVRSAAAIVGLIAAACLWLALAIQPAHSQTDADYTQWNNFATSVEQQLDEGTATDAVLTQMRINVVDWRRRFADAQGGTPSVRITTLQDQLTALGPAPASGETEAADVASRRAELQAELSAAQAPAMQATEAYGRADGIVTEIDRQLRARQTTELLTTSPSPLLPSSWREAADSIRTVSSGVISELDGRVSAINAAKTLPGALALLAVAVFMLAIGRRWIRKLADIAVRTLGGRGHEVVAFFVSVADLMLPVVGVWLILAAIEATGLVGPWLRPFIQSAGLAGFTYYAGLWTAQRLFPLDPDQEALNGLRPPRRDRARQQAVLVVAALALHHVFTHPLLPLSGMTMNLPADAVVPTPFSEGGAGVAHLILILLAAVPLFRLGHLLRRSYDETAGTLDRAVAFAGSIVRLVAIGAPLAAMAGFVSAANAVIWPTIMTMAVIGLGILLQRFLASVWRAIRGAPEGETLPLAPVVIAFVLILAALPLLALIWGARPSDLSEVWTRMSNGFRIGTIRLSPGAVLTFILIFTLGYTLTRGAQRTLRTSVLPRTRIDAGGQNAIVAGLGYLGIFLAALMAITSAGIDLSNLALVASALSVGIGFGLQNIISNFVSGIILLIERPVTVGDWVKVGDSQGIVQRIAVRSTVIRTFDRTEVIVPNSDLITKPVTNWTRGSLSGRVIVPITVAYGSDTRKVDQVLHAIAEDQPTVLIDPKPLVVFMAFGDAGLDFELRVIVSNINQGVSIATEIRHQILARFAAEGIELPGDGTPGRVITIKNPEALAAAVAHAGPQPVEPASELSYPEAATETQDDPEK